MGKTALSEQQKKLFHGLWKEIVMSKNDGFCIVEGCGEMATDPHHVFSKGAHGWMSHYDPDNGVPMCREHHTEYHATADDDIELSIWSYFEEFNIDYEALRFKSGLSNKRDFSNIQIVDNLLLERSVIEIIDTVGIFEFEYSNQKRACKRECGSNERTIECQSSCKHCNLFPFIARIDGGEWARIPANGEKPIEGKLGSRTMMMNGKDRFFAKWGSLLDVSRNKFTANQKPGEVSPL
jgi:hypothetical protein